MLRNDCQLLQFAVEARSVYILYSEEERAAGEGCVGLRNGELEQFRVFDPANDVAFGVIDRDGRLGGRECDGLRWGVLSDQGRESLELGSFTGDSCVPNVDQKRIEDKQGKDDDHHSE